MKIFYTERDIADLHASGVREIEVHDDVVLTELAREKVAALGISLKQVEACGCAPEPAPIVSSPPVKAAPALDQAELVNKVKARVMARLGTTAYNAVLDQVIPQVVARLTSKHPQAAAPAAPPKTGGY
jgi:hypothetical protein